MFHYCFEGITKAVRFECCDRQETGGWYINSSMEWTAIWEKTGKYWILSWFVFNRFVMKCYLEIIYLVNITNLVSSFQAYFKLQEDRKREYLIAMRQYKDSKGISQWSKCSQIAWYYCTVFCKFIHCLKITIHVNI